MNLKNYMPGAFLLTGIALLSIYLASLHASFDALVISIIIGMVIGNMAGVRRSSARGMDIGTQVLLPVGIALYGMQLSISALQPGLVLSIFLVFSALFGGTMLLSRVFSLGSNLTLLLASGLSICGASAIAIISPLIGAKREETSISILSVMMLGLFGMIFYPLVYDFSPLSREEFNFFAGTTLPMVGQVKVAAGSVAPESLESALQIKLVRIAFLFFVLPLVVFRAGVSGAKVKIPWFAAVFLVLAVLVNTVPLLRQLQDISRTVSTFCFAAGLGAIGFSVDFDAIVQEGMTPLVVILSVWAVVLIAIYLLKAVV
ncbi:MAG: putative sulfate exporter family transporter [Nitrospirae bacterium]|nr:putative sulfate exporter family transporter [Nitrospirota bacterium]